MRTVNGLRKPQGGKELEVLIAIQHPDRGTRPSWGDQERKKDNQDESQSKNKGAALALFRRN
jgi:hypothetical protein